MSLQTDWLAGIDPSWGIRRPKSLFSERRQPSQPDDIHLTPSQSLGVLPQSEYMKVTGTKVVLNLTGADNMKHVEPDDFVIHLRSFQGGIEHSRYAGKVSNAYTVFAPLPEVEPRFFRWVLKSQGFIQELNATTEQLRDGQSIKFEQFSRIGLPFPPLVEQRRIADFLDNQVARIDGLQERRRTQMDGLASIVQQECDDAFVLPNGKLGPPPVRAARFLSVLPGFSFPSECYSDDDTDVRLLRGVNVGVGRLRWDEVVYWPKSRAAEVSAFGLRSGDIVLGMDRPWIGAGLRVARLRDEDLPCFLLQRVAKLQLSAHVHPDFVVWAYRSSSFKASTEINLTGLSVPHLSGEQILNHELPVLSLSDQFALAKRLTELEVGVAGISVALRRSIDWLTEYKRSLITAAVTGEFDVSAASGRGVPA